MLSFNDDDICPRCGEDHADATGILGCPPKLTVQLNASQEAVWNRCANCGDHHSELDVMFGCPRELTTQLNAVAELAWNRCISCGEHHDQSIGILGCPSELTTQLNTAAELVWNRCISYGEHHDQSIGILGSPSELTTQLNAAAELVRNRCISCGEHHDQSIGILGCPSEITTQLNTAAELVWNRCTSCEGDHGNLAICPTMVNAANLSFLSPPLCDLCGGDHGSSATCPFTPPSVGTSMARLTAESLAIGIPAYASSIVSDEIHPVEVSSVPHELTDVLASLKEEFAELRAYVLEIETAEPANGLIDLDPWAEILQELDDRGWHTARNELLEAIWCMKRDPQPGRSGAMTHSSACLEIVARSVSGRGNNLGPILKRFPEWLGISRSFSNVLHDKVWKPTSNRARHMREGTPPSLRDARQVFSFTVVALEEIVL